MLSTPVLLVAYNRVDLLRRVLVPILEARPRTLLLAADGPREVPGDAEKCAAVRSVLDGVEGDGRVLRHYARENLGSGARVATAIDWALEGHEEVIVLEDDLVADPSFFPFCAELLARYGDDERIGMISGGNYQFGRVRGPYSYYFSGSAGTWGWATWRRAWRHFDFRMDGWPAARDTPLLTEWWRRPEPAQYWRGRFDLGLGGPRDIWDYQWAFALWSHGLLQVVPNRNLISCIGCGPEATHLTSPDELLANLPLQPLAFPLAHPPLVARDRAADLWEFHRLFTPLPPEALEAG